jgi:hypothetical protein
MFNSFICFEKGHHMPRLLNTSDVYQTESRLCSRFFDQIKPVNWENVEINEFKKKLQALGQ